MKALAASVLERLCARWPIVVPERYFRGDLGITMLLNVGTTRES